jgi:hypothetical protein
MNGLEALKATKKTKALAAAAITGTVTCFTITNGPVRVDHLGMLVTTAIPAGANTLKFQHTPTDGSATDLCGTADTASASAMDLFMVDGVKATALAKNADNGISLKNAEGATHMPIILSPGVITAVFSGGPPATGAATIFIDFEPMTPTAKVS